MTLSPKSLLGLLMIALTPAVSAAGVSASQEPAVKCESIAEPDAAQNEEAAKPDLGSLEKADAMFGKYFVRLIVQFHS